MTGPSQEPPTGMGPEPVPAPPGGGTTPDAPAEVVGGRGDAAGQADVDASDVSAPAGVRPDDPTSTEWVEPIPPTLTPVWTPDRPPPTGGPAGWVTPEVGSGGGRYRGCAIGCVVVAALVGIFALASVVALVFLGGQIQSILKGSVEFGTGGTGCSVTARAESFPTSTSLHFVAYLDRQVSAGETITVVQTYPDGPAEPVEQTVDTTADCLFGDVNSGPSTGRYTIEVRAGAEQLAKGGVDITP
jgi:hypothetical protein